MNIRQHIVQGTIIISDLWAAYNTLGYQDLTVNHTYNFVDPITGACTNHIESVWQKAKQNTNKDMEHTKNLDTYLGYVETKVWA